MKILKSGAAAVIFAMLLSQTALADNVIVAPSPGSGQTAAGTSSTASAGYATISGGGYANGYVDTAYGPVISQTGPTGTKSYSEKGYLVIGGEFTGGTPSYDNGTGPGGSNTAGSSGTVSAPSGTTAQTSQTSQTGPAAASAAASNAESSSAAAVSVSTASSVAAPAINGGAAVLYDASTREILFDKNGTASMYPASTTKLMTALLAAERLSLSDTITFQASAVNNLESGAVTAGMQAGDTMTVKDALYAMLLRSACEVANGVAERVSGSQSAFAELMNQRARELGCTGTHFENASGLNGNHYTTARDMALITEAALKNETVRTVLQTKTYTLPATTHRGALTCNNSNRLLPGGADYYEGIIGGKTGYTSKAGSCLASGIERGGHMLIAVVFKSNTTQYTDTKALYDYGVKRLNLGSASASGTSSAGTAASAAASASANTAGKWEQTSAGWKYQKAGGSYYTNEWLDLNGNTYFFDGNSLMVTGWKQFTNGAWYYFNPENGAMVRGKWVTQDQKSYYLQDSGVMATNTVIDGKYRVNENGVYIEKVG